MSSSDCRLIADSVATFFDSAASSDAQHKLQQHLTECAVCHAEIAALSPVAEVLTSWQMQAVPDWDKKAVRQLSGSRPRLRRHAALVARWAPLAASLLLAVAVLTQTQLHVSEGGWSLHFGSDRLGSDRRYADAQHAETQQWVEAALRAHGETTADSLYQWMRWMEQQREQDVQRMEAGFQQLLDRDFQTVDSVRQLASYLIYQDTP